MAAEHGEETETLTEKIAVKFHRDDSSSYSSDDEKKPESSPSTFKPKVFRIFGREKPIHQVLGGVANVFLWRDKKVSATVLGGVTTIWVLFEQLDYHLLTLVCHSLILTLAVMFVYSNATTFINKAPPRIPEVSIPEDLAVRVALGLRYEINRGVAFLRSVASGRDIKKFLVVIGDCRIMGAIGCWEPVQFLDLFYSDWKASEGIRQGKKTKPYVVLSLILLSNAPAIHSQFIDFNDVG